VKKCKKRQKTLKIAYYGLFHKKSFMFPLRGDNMDCFKNKRLFVRKPMRFLALFAVYTSKKKDFVKRIRLKNVNLAALYLHQR
jgi:hypothetical protein